MKTTNALQRIAAGMLTFSLVVMFAVLGFGLTKPIWAADGVWEVSTLNELQTAFNDAADGDVIRLTGDIINTGSVMQFNNSGKITLDLNGCVLTANTEWVYPPEFYTWHLTRQHQEVLNLVVVCI